ncbi:MAG: NUDIX hydrolase [Candidatus Magasanikbacteria bacterium]|nr:NUDIX hydrolase [Candidatus Magasanikbacteria bacterium]
MRKIPDNAKKVFGGIIYDVYQWEQQLFDGSKALFEKLKRPDTVIIIPAVEGRILIVREEQPGEAKVQSLAGGRVEKGEEPFQTAKRELLEETGYVSKDWDLFKVYHPLHKIEWDVYVYIARNCEKRAEQHLDPGERIETVLLDFDEFVEAVSSEHFHANELARDILRLRLDQRNLDAFRMKLFPR